MKVSPHIRRIAFPVLVAAAAATSLAMKRENPALTVYSGRSEELIRPLIDQFSRETGIRVRVRYGGTAELAATIMEEGRNSPADVLIAQDAGALGALNRHGRLTALPPELLTEIDPRYRSPNGAWVGISGRARVVVYNTTNLAESDLPDDLAGFTAPAWRGRLGWAPENGSFQSFITALRIREGDARTLAWLKAIQANLPRVYGKNSALVAAVAAGEIDAGFSNHYYVYAARRTRPNLAVANYYFPRETAGNLVNVAGAGALASSRQPEAAHALIRFLLSPEAQRYFVVETREFPVIQAGIDTALLAHAPQANEIPQLDLNALEDLEGTLRLLQQAGIL